MMWPPLLVCLAVGLASAEYAWKPNTEYKYVVEGRTLVALHQVANDFVGVLSRATLTLQPTTANDVFAWLSDSQYSPVQLTLPGGWTSRIPEKALNYKSLPLSSKPFQIKFKNGVVDGLVVNKDLSTPEVNFIKSVVSQLQVDTQGTNGIKWEKEGQAPQRTRNNVFRTMEDTITGQCEVMYDISALPMYAVQINPELVPMPNLIGGGRVYDIVKTKNFSNCDKKVAYHFGFTGLSNWEPGANQMGHFFSRSGISRIAISGSLEKYTIQSSVTVNKIVLSPAMYNAQKGMVSSRMNVTLISVQSTANSPPSLPNPKYIKDLVYEYNDPFPSSTASGRNSSEEDRSLDLSGDSSSENDQRIGSQEDDLSGIDSGERLGHKRQNPKRSSRSALQENTSSGSREDESSAEGSNEMESGCGDSSGDVCSGGGSTSNEGRPLNDGSNYNSRPEMDKAPKIPLLPYFIGYQGSSVHSAKNLDPVSAIKKLCSQIASELQDPGSIPQKATLAKFSVVERLIRTMSTEQLRKATSEIYAPIKSAGENPWPVFRDAVATAGTGPCLSITMEWIKAKKISQGEAAEVVATIAAKARTPTAEYIKAFFALATSPEVTKQPLLNSTAMLSFANLACKAQVSKTSARRSFPVYAFGLLSPINPREITEEYIPYMAKQLRLAVKDGDSHKMQVYIQALGNLAHPMILGAFEPYLEGKVPMSTFQRTLMVASLNKLSKVCPHIARRVLFNMYRNVEESHEVRSAAAIVLMRAAPPAPMLHRMAEFSNRDPSTQVGSLVQSLIRSAADLQGPDFFVLKKNAQAAVHLLGPRQTGPFHQSDAYIRTYMVKEMGLAYRKELSWIGSSDGIMPSSAFLSIRQNIGGWKAQGMMMSVMTSNINDLVDALSEKFAASDLPGDNNKKYEDKYEESQSHFPTGNIEEMLNIVPRDKKQVEGNIFFSHLDSNRLLTFDQAMLNNLPTLLQEAGEVLRSGYQYNYNKLYDKASITLAFPTETSLPFVYTLKVPAFMSLRGEVQARVQPDLAAGHQDYIKIPESINASAKLHFAWSSRMSAKLSFVAPMTTLLFAAGIEKDILINLPIKASLNLETESKKASMTLQPLYPDRDSSLFQYSNRPYTAIHDILDLKPICQGKYYKEIHIREPQTLETTVGQDTTGFSFHAKYTSEKEYLDIKSVLGKFERHDATSFLLYPWAERYINYNNITLSYDSHKSSSESATISFSYGKTSSGSSESKINDATEPVSNPSVSVRSPSSSKPMSAEREQEFIQNVSSGIHGSKASVLDFAAEFDGRKKMSYVATIAYASSDVDETTRAQLYLYKSPSETKPKQFEVCVSMSGKWPKVPFMNFTKALEANIASYVSSEIRFGEKCSSESSRISISARGKQSQGRKTYLRRSTTGQQCMSQMQSGSYLQPACRNITARANFLDSYSIKIYYEKLPIALKNFTYKAFAMTRYLGYPYFSEKTVDARSQEGEMSVDVDFQPDLSAVNLSLSAPSHEVGFNLVPVHRRVTSLVEQQSTSGAEGRSLFDLSTSSCGLDRNSISTFDNKTYPIHLEKCWHVLMITQPGQNESSSSIDPTSMITILARDYSAHEKEMKVILGNEEFNLMPSASMSSDKLPEGDTAKGFVIYNHNPRAEPPQPIDQVTGQNGQILASWHTLPTGTVTFEAPQHDFTVMYNGEAAWIRAGSSYRGKVFGLCGTYSRETADDFTSPKNCILAEPKLFAASWAVPDESCQGGAKDLQQQAASAPCHAQTISPQDVIDQEDYATSPSSTCTPKVKIPSQFENGKLDDSTSGCTQHRTMVVEEESQICFSKTPILACADQCHAAGKVAKNIQVHCVSKSPAARLYMDKVKKGSTPDFSRKETTKVINVNVAEGCSANNFS
ncbi:vitellogenin-like [Ischnura elegans]|uniref:vitellogenin-like n=1 Tax=Ischnura elegans TaxID=197161 RepID=UPI001ED8819E|nr:vitellogenin-like [Ischnura elegans]